MRKYVFLAALLLMLAGARGDQWQALWRWASGREPPPLLVAAMAKVTEWLSSFVESPAVFIVGLLLLAAAVPWPKLLQWILRKRDVKEWFLRTFHETSADRSTILEITERNYEKWRTSEQPARLSDLARRARMPNSLPLPSAGSLLLYAEKHMQAELNDAARELYALLQRFYPIPGWSQDSALHAARRNVAKFWDEVGRKVRDGPLSLEDADVRAAIKTQQDDLVMLCFLEIAQVQQRRWDRGPGKGGLFYITHRAQEIG
jgi:hypothetical protein